MESKRMLQPHYVVLFDDLDIAEGLTKSGSQEQFLKNMFETSGLTTSVRTRQVQGKGFINFGPWAHHVFTTDASSIKEWLGKIRNPKHETGVYRRLFHIDVPNKLFSAEQLAENRAPMIQKCSQLASEVLADISK